MKPIDQVLALYRDYPQPRTFEEDIMIHLRTGYVIGTPEFFIMGRAVKRDADPRLLDDPSVTFESPDAWLVFAFAGSSRNFLDYVPYPLQWIAFQRRGNPLRFYDFTQLSKRIRRQNDSRPFLFRRGWGPSSEA